MGSHIFGILGVRKLRLIGIQKWEDIYYIKFNKCVNSFQDHLVNRFYKVDALTESG